MDFSVDEKRFRILRNRTHARRARCLRSVLSRTGNVRYSEVRRQSTYSSVVSLDLGTERVVAGPKRPQDRIEIGNVKREFTRLFSAPVLENGFNQPGARLSQRFALGSDDGVRAGVGPATPEGAPRDVVEMKGNRPLVQPAPAPERGGVSIADGDVLIAAITSCTNTSNPACCSRRAASEESGRSRTDGTQHIKTSLAPGSRIVTDY